ncbi:MAG: GWxTD domain-containing protein [Bacteroidales bacterium]|jgi:GWxTD domain-containing protein|nr:GWxTD domain-containing protein [Bacteroidales bacterium]
MKKLLFVLFFVTLFLNGFSQKLRVSLDFNAYATSNIEPYLEIRYIIDGQSVKYVQNQNSKYEAEVEISTDILINDSLFKSIHYILSSAEYTDTSMINKTDFADVVNVQLPEGTYFLDFTIKDRNSEDVAIHYLDMVEVYFPTDSISSSSLRLLSSLSYAKEDDFYVKYGYSMPPLNNQYVPEHFAILPYYLEVYNTERVLGKGNKFIIDSYIEDFSPNQKMQTIFFVQQSYNAAPLTVATHIFNLSLLPSGNYFLVTEIKDTTGNVFLINKSFFQRNNPGIDLNIEQYASGEVAGSFVEQFTDLKTLQDYVSSLYPISNALERSFYDKRVKNTPLDQLQRFFLSFWYNRDAKNPEQAWLVYKAEVEKVQQMYGSKILKGYRSDRGRVYLQYGPPNDIRESPFSSKITPYEIWHYNFLNGQNRVKFVFHNPDLTTNNYILIHSTLLGEPSNPAWQRDMQQDRQGIDDWYERKPADFYGNDMDKYWDNF